MILQPIDNNYTVMTIPLKLSFIVQYYFGLHFIILNMFELCFELSLKLTSNILIIITFAFNTFNADASFVCDM